MRRIISALSDIRQLQLKAIGAPDTRRQQIAEMFVYFDGALGGLSHDVGQTGIQEVMTSADFTFAIQEFVQRQTVPGYKRKGFAFEPLVKPDTLPNYLTVTRYQKRAGLEDLEHIAPKGTARPGSVVDATKRQYRVYKWGKQFDFEHEALVNDDLAYFADQATLMGEAARRTIEKFVSRMYTNAVSIAALTALGALFAITGRLTSTRISEARMAYAQRVDARNEPIRVSLRYLVHHTGLIDTVRQIQNSQLVPELATNAENVIRSDFIPIEDPYIAGTAPTLPWWAFPDWRTSSVVPFVLARRAGVLGPMILRKRSDIESVTSMLGTGTAVSPIWGDFMTGNIEMLVLDIWGTYNGGSGNGNYFDTRGGFYSSATAP